MPVDHAEKRRARLKGALRIGALVIALGLMVALVQALSATPDASGSATATPMDLRDRIATDPMLALPRQAASQGVGAWPSCGPLLYS